MRVFWGVTAGTPYDAGRAGSNSSKTASADLQEAYRGSATARSRSAFSQVKLLENQAKAYCVRVLLTLARTEANAACSLNASQHYEGEPDLATGENEAKLRDISACSSTVFTEGA